MGRNWEAYDGNVVRRYAADYSAGDPFPEPYKFQRKEELLNLPFVNERCQDVDYVGFFYSVKQKVLLRSYLVGCGNNRRLEYSGICYPLNSKTHETLASMFPDVPNDCPWTRA